MSAPFEADMDPDTGAPRIRFTFANGRTASVVLRGGNGCDFMLASLATMEGRRVTQLGETEASPDEVVAYLAEVMDRPPVKWGRYK